MSGVVSIGEVPWSRQDLIAALEEFAALYAARPLRGNHRGGMAASHLFYIWFALRALRPRAIVESGVFQGLGTWLFEQTCPGAELHCIDPDQSRIVYRSERARYYDRDFSTIDWSGLPADETVFFFDDHQDAYERVKTCAWFGFRQHLFFDDNQPPRRGDCYSLKKAWMHGGFGEREVSLGGAGLVARLRPRAHRALRRLGLSRLPAVPADAVDAAYLRRGLALYYEFPPVFKTARTRWNDPWDEEGYPTPEALLGTASQAFHQPFLAEAPFYNWMCYVKLR